MSLQFFYIIRPVLFALTKQLDPNLFWLQHLAQNGRIYQLHAPTWPWQDHAWFIQHTTLNVAHPSQLVDHHFCLTSLNLSKFHFDCADLASNYLTLLAIDHEIWSYTSMENLMSKFLFCAFYLNAPLS